MILAVALPVLSLSFFYGWEKLPSECYPASVWPPPSKPLSALLLTHLSSCSAFVSLRSILLSWGSRLLAKLKGLGFLFLIQKFSKDFCGAFQRIQIAKQNAASPFEHQRLRVWAHKHLKSCCTSATSQELLVCILFSLCVCKRACLSYHRE